MKKSEQNAGGNPRPAKQLDGLRRQDIPAAIQGITSTERRTLTLDLSARAWSYLEELASTDAASIEDAARRAIGRDAATLITGGSSGENDEPIVAAFLDRGTAAQHAPQGGLRVVLDFNEYAHAALRFFTVCDGYENVQDAVAGCVQTCVGTLTQLTEEEFTQRFSGKGE